MARLRLLILGGTTEASALARMVADDRRFDATLSLAGRTRIPVRPPVPLRVGGFGGAEGLARHLAGAFEVLVDATHPFAARISHNAAEAAMMADVPLIAVRRPGWLPIEGDRWLIVRDMTAAVAALGAEPKRIFVTIGQKELAPFRTAPQHHYLIRSVDPPDPGSLPPDAEVITMRGPFDERAERRLLAERRIQVVVTKNSGGTATEAKLAAARALSLPVVVVERPTLPEVEAVDTAEAAMAWLVNRHGVLAGTLRGV